MTQYKWLPKQPTNEMLDAVFALEEPNTLREYDAMWQAAPKREPLSKEAIGSLWEMHGVEDNPIPFARAIEKAHGIRE